jgi:uncharacterized protein YegJ (DUF2314 family)
MKISETNFRTLYKQFVLLKIHDAEMLAQIGKTLVFPSDTDAFLTYCYIDDEAGLSFHVLCPGVFDAQKLYPYQNEQTFFIFRSGENDQREFKIISRHDTDLSTYDETVNIITTHHGNAQREEMRSIAWLDALRAQTHPDDIKILLVRDGCQLEEVWIRVLKFREQGIIGQLLNEPFQDFGVHSHSELFCQFTETKNKETIAFCDCNASQRKT